MSIVLNKRSSKSSLNSLTIPPARIDHAAHSSGEWPICHGVSRRAFNERGASGIRNILKPAISGKPRAASADTKTRIAAGTSPLINRLIAFV